MPIFVAVMGIISQPSHLDKIRIVHLVIYLGIF